jgi:hypothetical protein
LVPGTGADHSLGDVKDEVEARLLAQREIKNGQRRPGLKRGERSVVEADAWIADSRRDREASPGSKREAGYQIRISV